MDPDPHSIYTKRKERDTDSSTVISDSTPRPKYPSEGWSSDLKRMPFFTRAEMNNHVSKSGKNIDSRSNHSVPTSVRKATTFLNDEYLKDLSAASDDNYFYFHCHCHHSFRKNDPPHNLKVALCILSGEVIDASCSCVAGQVGYCNHILALLLKLCKFTLYECRSITDLDSEEDMQPKRSCTSSLQQWHRKGRGDSINPQPVMEVLVTKTSLDQDQPSKSRAPGVKCLLYEARKSLKNQQADETKLLEQLKEINPKMALAQILTPRSESTPLLKTKFGKSPQGSYGSYQLSITEDNFKVFCDISTVPRVDSANSNDLQITEFPRFPLNQSNEKFEIPAGISGDERSLLEKLQADDDKVNEIERKTRGQSNCQEWKDERKFRFTASNFGLICGRKRNHETLVKNLLNPKHFTSRYTNHGLKYEPIALEQYQKYMMSIRRPVQVFKSGLVISSDFPYLGASPDGKVVDPGCSNPFGLSEVKCPETKYLVTPLDACSDSNFFLEEVNGMPKLKRTHKYYTQVEGLMGVTGARWCDFVVYTSKGMSIERIPFDVQFWNDLRETLKLYYFRHFLALAAKEP